MSGLLVGKVVIVTGAAGGIGSVAARLFAEEGAKVLAADVDYPGVEAVVSAISEAGGQAVAMKVDITQEDQVKAMVDLAISTFGRLDCALNNVGMGVGRGTVIDLEEADFTRGLNLNVIGTWLCMKHEIRRMLENGGGSIVNMASLAGVLGVPNGAVYSAAKHAVIGLTKSAAVEFGQQGIRVNAVCPGVVMTPRMRKAVTEGRVLRPTSAQMRAAEPEEVAELALWLLSARSSHVTGQPINIDGGRTIGASYPAPH